MENKRKQSLYIPDEMLREMVAAAARQDRSLSWIVQRAWRVARGAIMAIPSVNARPGAQPKGEELAEVTEDKANR